jgi:hypothetical protein
MHEGYSCEEFDAKYHAGLAKLWDALEMTHSDILVSHADVFEEAAGQINAYHKLIAKMIFKNGEPIGWILKP